MQIWITLLPFLGAVIGAMIGATISPFVQWQIEKKRQRLTYRRELITGWRKMLEETAKDRDDSQAAKDIHQVMLRHSDFYSLVLYSRPPDEADNSDMMHAVKMADKYKIPSLVVYYLGEVQRLEKEWKLV